MIIMSVDLGKARTGIAVSDSGESFAFPKEVINEYSTERLVEKICGCAVKYSAELIVVGYPKNMDGSAGSRALECAEIADMIKEKSGKSIVMWDERCTTVSAHTALNYTDTRGKKRKSVIDAVAAVIILEDYLSYRKNKKAEENI
ncbi:MAG: Holliday junction resolvase RuvX [Acutalibacteraceae bacterium]|nr:Holliday junction resolvase RuvX [Clostridia bacterium]MEE1329845.1 Holliday junction resolvase RuvX [Acutalibacteraceae bacterium]